MATCKDVYAFLDSVRRRAVTTTLPAPDLAALGQAGLVSVVTTDRYAQMTQELATLADRQAALGAEVADRAQRAGALATEESHTHSILFHLEGRDRRQAESDRAARDAAALTAEDQDLSAKKQQLDALFGQRALVDSLTPFPGGYVGLSGAGALACRDLGIRLYRASDLAFVAYWQQTQQVEAELTGIAANGSGIFGQIAPRLPSSDRSYLWSIAIGLSRSAPDAAAASAPFLSAYGLVGPLAHNDENRLMSAEVLAAIPRPVTESAPLLKDLEHGARKAGVAKESALGVASLLLFGRRQDGSFALPELGTYLRVTPSYESAALLAIVNRPFDELSQKFGQLKGLFQSWGFQPSEDSELAASYLAISDLPVEGISTKMTILSRGLAPYLEYPLVAAALLAAIPVLEANDTLNLLEHAYEIVGRRAMAMSQAELICLAVRMLHEIRDETIRGLDTTATPAPAAPPRAGGFYGPRFFFVPVIVYGSFYSTYGGVGGAHPAHVHAFGGAAG